LPATPRLDATGPTIAGAQVSSDRYAKPGAPKYGGPGNAAELAAAMRDKAQTDTLHVYGGLREAVAAEQVVMLETRRISCPLLTEVVQSSLLQILGAHQNAKFATGLELEKERL
jgi:hypothetical protein